ncbi:TonB-dependent receptor plug domain-containing protein [Winogradskyella eckloniae]|uniref:TonB-dependent receptor plug domain-containing protein n=1 Tax=Winogradskyella eckloniae TaxID=1089306 RepID=UPI001564E8E0|nr:TonB-dependent receptor plug domain-containing protein [Winogradskyella eckloniae]NRD18699.1 TonB-dependent receptor plug domain-containing protein [Winogradskyella eckloniae]
MTYIKQHIKILTVIVCLALSFLSFKAYKAINNPLEKIYTQTDRPFYFPSETIWFKSYVVGTDHTISTLSDIMHAELISPKGAVVKSLTLSIKQGYAYGDFDIDKNWVGGIYTLKCYTNWMNNFGDEAFFTKKITVQKVVKPNLLMNLKFEKEGYGKSSQVISNFEVKDLKNNPLAHTNITYTVSVKGNIIITKSEITDQKGQLKPTFTLPENLDSSDVVLNVLVDYKGTTESISRAVPVVLNTIDLQFLPESGKIIAGTLNKVAFKALNEFGKPVDVKGNILDENHVIVSNFESYHDGMGSFHFNPKKGTSYFAQLTAPFIDEALIPLPKIHDNGVRFSVTSDSLLTRINLFSTYSTNLFLEVSNANGILQKKKISNQKNVILNTEDYPIGITKFSIKNEFNSIFAERLVFINSHKQLHIDLTLDKETYQTREKAKLIIRTYDSKNKPIPANLSLAIADHKLLSFADDKQDHILSYLLLSSELKGKIHKPDFYFNPKEAKNKIALDLLMLTHGWRSYIDEPKVTLNNAQFLPEQSAIQSGVVLNKKGQPTTAKLLLFDDKGTKVLVFKTNKDGSFNFKYHKNRNLTLLAYKDNGERLTITKTALQKGTYGNETENNNSENKDGFKAFIKNEKLLKKPIKQNAIAHIGLEQDDSSLEEVVVVAYGTMKRSQLSGAIAHINAEQFDTTNSVINALSGKVAGVNIVNANGQPGSAPIVRMRGIGSLSGNNDPLIVIDGVPYEESVFADLDSNQVSSVTFLKDAAATSLYGSRGAYGVIVISTKDGLSYGNKKRLNNHKYNNYAIHQFYNYNTINVNEPNTFYMPKYEGTALPEERTDFRQTIYWNPVVQTNSEGIAELEFYNSDAITSFKIIAEGIGYNGLVGKQNKLYATKKMLNVGFKAPNYMVLNDIISLPITISNDTEKTLDTQLEIILPKHLKLVEPFKDCVTIDSHSAITKNIKVIPIEKGEDVEILIRTTSENYKDVVKKQATIISPYFPTELSLSDSKSQSFEFQLNHVVENSLSAEFNIYTDVIGDVMNGIEALIREPHGCFEQTSSSTYPNIMVLKYLKASGKSNPEIEAKAMDFIKKGYKRLISFETSEGGFEWFGNTPPHETLTAYGILEFTEMKEIYEGVNQNMINRTVQWLLSRKDGKGGFKKSEKGYDSFASSPSDVANAYIIYALSEANIKADLSLEYTTAFNDALKSNDTYKMALLAMTSYNLNKTENAKILMKKIKSNIDEFGFEELPVENTITRSYGRSKNIETTALTLLALMREATLDETLIAKGIDYLVKQRQYNRFGSTQATAMALKTLINYTKMQNQKMINENDSITLMINSKSLKRKLEVTTDGKITIRNIEYYLTTGKQNIVVKFNNPKTQFPYSLNLTWDSTLPNSSYQCPLQLETTILENDYAVGDNVSFTIAVTNTKAEPLAMTTAIIGIPSGTTAQPWQLKKLLEEHKAAYYEVFDNYIVFYWREFRASETKNIRLDLKADIAGHYQAPASTVYLYYGDENKTWISGNELQIAN